MLRHQGVELFENIIQIRRCGLDGGRVSLRLGFEVSKAQARPSLSIPASCHVSSLQPHVCLHVAMLLTMMMMD